MQEARLFLLVSRWSKVCCPVTPWIPDDSRADSELTRTIAEIDDIWNLDASQPETSTFPKSRASHHLRASHICRKHPNQFRRLLN